MSVRLKREEFVELFPEVSQIRDPALVRGIEDIWIDIAAECKWERLQHVPKNADSERHRALVDHIRGVTRIALAMSEIVRTQQGARVDNDVLTAACLLHDVSKVVEMEPDPDGPPTNGPTRPARKSDLGAKMQHAVYATHKIFAYGLPLEVAHLVVTHTHASNVRAKSLEAALLFYADYADSDAAITTVGGTTFAQRWELT